MTQNITGVKYSYDGGTEAQISELHHTFSYIFYFLKECLSAEVCKP